MDEIDVKKLERCYIDCSAELRSFEERLAHLRSENEHLRGVISQLLVTIQSFGNICGHVTDR